MGQSELTLDDETKLFFMELGLAISFWAGIEDTLRSVVTIGFKDDDEMALAVSYLSIENFRSKLEFADKMIGKKHGLNPDGANWVRLQEKLRSLSGSRNKLAHWGVRHFLHCKPGRRLVLCPWVYEKAKLKTREPMPPSGSLGLLDIVKLRAEFYALMVALANFGAKLRGQSAPYPESDEKAEVPPALHELARLIHGPLNRPSGESYPPASAPS